jgi:hypothetical protein
MPIKKRVDCPKCRILQERIDILIRVRDTYMKVLADKDAIIRDITNRLLEDKDAF